MKALNTLVIAAQQGDQQAFGEIVRRFQDMAYAVAYAALSDSQSAEDVAQEAFVEAYLHLAKLDDPAAFPGWFRIIVTRQCHRLLRGKRVPVVPLEIAMRTESTGASTASMIETRDLQTFVQSSIQSLPAHERQATMLFYIADYSQQEIADFLGIGISAVKSRLHRARNRLRERMIDMVQETLHEQRPSNDDEFTARVMTFIQVVEAGDAAQTQILLQETPNLADVKTEARYSSRQVRPLHIACAYGHRDVVEQLIANGADINAEADGGWRPLHYALRAGYTDAGHRDIADMLIAAGAEVDVFAAAQLGDLAGVEVFIQANPDTVHAIGPNDATPLHFASTVPVARYLLDHGANLEARDSAKQATPLYWNERHAEIAQFLVSRGAVIEDIFMACAIGDVERVAAFLDGDPALIHTQRNDRSPNPLFEAAYAGQVAVAQLLIERGVNVNAKSAAGQVTALHEAAGAGHKALVWLLVERGAALDARDTEFNATPLGWARFFNQDAVVTTLEKLGAED